MCIINHQGMPGSRGGVKMNGNKVGKPSLELLELDLGKYWYVVAWEVLKHNYISIHPFIFTRKILEGISDIVLTVVNF